MTKSTFILVLISAGLTAAANLLLRKALAGSAHDASLTEEIWRMARASSFLVGFSLYGVAILFWFRILSVVSVDTAYPVLVGLTFVLLKAGSTFILNEPFSLESFIGVLLILAGITVVANA